MATASNNNNNNNNNIKDGDDDVRLRLSSSLFECTVCFNDYNVTDRLPKSFACGHSVCAECVTQLLNSNNNNNNNRFACPQCRAEVEVTAVKNNFLMIELLEQKQKETKYHNNNGKDEEKKGDQNIICDECDDDAEAGCITCLKPIALCSLHRAAHEKGKNTKSHTIILSMNDFKVKRNELSKVAPPSFKCDKHRSETLLYYCKPCNAPICIHCIAVVHQSHKRMELSDALNKYSPPIIEKIQQIKNKLQPVHRALNTIEDDQETIPGVIENIRHTMQQRFNHYHEILNKRHQQLLTEAETLYQRKSKMRNK